MIRRLSLQLRPSLVAVFTLFNLVAHPDARANEQLRVAFDPCVADLGPQVQRLINIELSASSPSNTHARQAQVICQQPGGVTIRIDDPENKNRLERTLDLSTVAPRARVRALALAVVELLAAGRTELERAKASEPEAPPKPEPPAPVALQEEARPVPPPYPRWLCGLGVGYAPALGDFSAGPQLAAQVGFTFASPFVAMAELQAGERAAATSQGDIRWRALSWMLGLGIGRTSERFFVGGHIGPKLAMGQIVGRPKQATDVTGHDFAALLVGGSANLRAAAQLYDRLWLQVSVDGGWVLSPVKARVDGVVAAKLDGHWSAAHVSMALAF